MGGNYQARQRNFRRKLPVTSGVAPGNIPSVTAGNIPSLLAGNNPSFAAGGLMMINSVIGALAGHFVSGC